MTPILCCIASESPIITPKLHSPWNIVEASQGVKDKEQTPLKARPKAGQTDANRHNRLDIPELALEAQTKESEPPKSHHRRRFNISEESRIRLLSDLPLQTRSASETKRLQNYVNELGLEPRGLTDQALAWKVEKESSEFLELPPQKPHSGDFECIGKAPEALPSYLWDSE